MKKNYKWRNRAFFKNLMGGMFAAIMFIGLSGSVNAQVDCTIDNQQGGVASGTLSLFAIAGNGISTLFDPTGTGDFGDPGCYLSEPYSYAITSIDVLMADASLFGIADEGLGTLEYVVSINSVVDDSCTIMGAEVWTSTTLTEVMGDEGWHPVNVPVNYVTTERVFVTVKTVSWSGSLTRSPSAVLWSSVTRPECHQFVTSAGGTEITAMENFYSSGLSGWTTVAINGTYADPVGDVDFAVNSVTAPDTAWVDVVTVPVEASVSNLGDFNVQDAMIVLKEDGTGVDTMYINLGMGDNTMVTFNYAPTAEGDRTVTVEAMVAGDVDAGNDAQSTVIYGKTYVPPCTGVTIICDGFDLYAPGPINGQGSWWSTWSGQLGGAEDGIVTTDQFKSAPHSMFTDSTGAQDILLLLGNQTEGTYAIDFSFYVPAGRGGYYNIQEDEVAGVAWNLDVFFNEDGGQPGVGTFAQSDSTFTYPEDAWFDVHMVIDLDADLMSFFVDGALVFEGFVYDGSIGSIDIYSIDGNNKMYTDDVAYYVTEPLSDCDFPTIICDNIDSYPEGPLGPNASFWTTWSGTEGGAEDGIVSSAFANSAPNSVFIDSTGAQDVLLLLGNRTEGTYSLDFNVYIPAGRGGYYNFQEDEVAGVGWNLDVFFNEDGGQPGVGTFAQSDSTFAYNEDAWNAIHQVIDLDADLMSFYVNGALVFEGFVYDGALGSIDIYSIDGNNKAYFDDVIFDDAEPLSPCGFPTIICDNIDSYPEGPLGPNAAHWTTWSGTEGGAEDGIVSSAQANSAPNSVFIDSTGAQDVLLLLGNKDAGSYSVEFNVYIPSGQSGYYNFQEDEVAGVGWILDVYFNEDAAPGVGSFAQFDTTFTYPEDEWFAVKHVFDLDANLSSMWVDGDVVFEGFVVETPLGAIDYYSRQDNNKMYFDDVIYDEAEALSPCSFPTFICDNFDTYSTGALGPQASWWTTWSGDEGGAEDGIVTTDQALSAPNSMFIDNTGAQDVLLLLGNRHVGTYIIEMDFYVPSGATGYYNIQQDEVAGIGWNLDVFFNEDGLAPGEGSFAQSDINFTYPEDEWFHINMGINLNTNLLAFTVNGVVVLDDFVYGGDLGALDFWSIDDMNQMYVDDVKFYGEDVVSVQELTSMESFNLYPNPNDGNFTIQSGDLEGTFVIDMVDVTGRVVYSEQMILSKNENRVVSINDLNTGVYILRMVDNTTSEVYTTRVTVQ